MDAILRLNGLQWTALGAIFLTTALALEGLVLLWHSQRGPAARRLRSRLQAWIPEIEKTPAAPAQSSLPTTAQPLRLRLEQAGWGWSPAALLGLSAALGLVSALTVLLGMGDRATVLMALLAGALAAAAPLLVMEVQRTRRLRDMAVQLPDALDLMARALRGGHAFAAAVQMAAEEGPMPLAKAFAVVHDQITYGRDPDDAFEDFARRLPLDDVRFFVIAVRLQRQTGGPMAEVLGNLSRLIRQRLQLQDKVRVLSAEGRLSAQVLAAMPVVTAAAIYLIRPDFIRVLWTDPLGLRWLQFSLLLFVVGVAWLWKLTRLRV